MAFEQQNLTNMVAFVSRTWGLMANSTSSSTGLNEETPTGFDNLTIALIALIVVGAVSVMGGYGCIYACKRLDRWEHRNQQRADSSRAVSSDHFASAGAQMQSTLRSAPDANSSYFSGQAHGLTQVGAFAPNTSAIEKDVVLTIHDDPHHSPSLANVSAYKVI